MTTNSSGNENGNSKRDPRTDLESVLGEMIQDDAELREKLARLSVSPDPEVVALAQALATKYVSVQGELEKASAQLADNEKVITDLTNRVGEESKEKEMWHQRAITDAMMGIFNRACFDDDLPRAITRANFEYQRAHAHGKHYGGLLGLAIVDIDYFKSVNDTFGHIVGDTILRNVASSIKESVRFSDRIYRYGGEEIAIIFTGDNVVGGDDPEEYLSTATRRICINVFQRTKTPYTPRELIAMLGQKTVRSLKYGPGQVEELWEQRFEEMNPRPGAYTKNRQISVSIGAALYRPDRGVPSAVDAAKELIARADANLYGVKQAGRNGVSSTNLPRIDLDD